MRGSDVQTRKRNRVILVGCGKLKHEDPCDSDSMYTGSLFRMRRAYAREQVEKYGVRWFIISAKYGLLAPGVVIKPYDMTLKDLSVLDQMAWAVGVVRQYLDQCPDAPNWTARDYRRLVFEIHAGAEYADRLSDILVATGFSAHKPVCGLSQGEQMKWYKENTGRIT